MAATLESLISCSFPSKQRGVDWMVLKYSGKSDLERNMVQKMKNWAYGNPTFIILRDADGANCIELKNRLSAMASRASGKPYKNTNRMPRIGKLVYR